MSKSVLITGGAGFIGSNFVRYLKDRYPGYRLVILDALTYAGSTDNLPANVVDRSDELYEFWYGNVCNAELMDTLTSQADMVLHFAAETHVTRSIYDNLQFFQTDVLGTHTVSNAVLKAGDRIKRFIHISSSEVYGTAIGEKMDENHPLEPMSPYASAKAGADRLVYSYWATYGIPSVIVRPFNTYGPNQHLEKVVPRFLTSAILNEPLTVHGDGSAARDYIHVDDLCAAIDLLMHAPEEKVVGQAFNVASGHHRSILGIAEDIVAMANYDASKISLISDRPGQVVRHTGDWSKIHRTVGWSPEVSWEEGLKSTFAWYKSHQEWWRKQIWMRSIPIATASGKVEYH